MRPAKNIIIPNDDEPSLKDLLEWCEKEFIIDAMTMAKGNVAHASQILGMGFPNILHRKIRRFGINATDFK